MISFSPINASAEYSQFLIPEISGTIPQIMYVMIYFDFIRILEYLAELL